MSGFLTSGRRTRFMPTGEASRSTRVRESADGATTAPDPVIVRERGEAAARLIETPEFRLAFDLLAGEAQEKFENSAPGPAGSADRDSAHATLLALGGIQTRLNSMVEDAKISAAREADESDNGE